MILHEIIDVVASDSVKQSLVGHTAGLAFLHLLEHSLIDAAILGLRHHREGSHQTKSRNNS